MNKKKIIEDFERTKLLAEAKFYSELSLERELTDLEFNEYNEVMNKLK